MEYNFTTFTIDTNFWDLSDKSLVLMVSTKKSVETKKIHDGWF